MATVTRQPSPGAAKPRPANLEDNTLDEQHAGIGEREFPSTDNDESADAGQSHVADPACDDDRQRRIAKAAYLRAERRGFEAGGELEDWLEAERDEKSRSG